LHKANQRKIVRDSDGYWYSFWVESSGYIMAKRSNDTNGNNWSSSEIELAGSIMSVINGAMDPSFYPSVAIYKNSNISKNQLHMVWCMKTGTNMSICYSKCTNITSIMNFSKTNSWCKADDTPGYDVLINNVNLDIIDNYGFASIAVDPWNQPHVVWQYEYLNNSQNYFRINYTTWNNSLGWHNGNSEAINITPWIGFGYKSPSIEISHNGIIHVAFSNVSSTHRTIEYRQCWNISDSMNTNFWGNASKVPYKKDIVISNSTGGNMSEPSLICDSIGAGRVWIVTSEKTKDNYYNIWYSIEDFQDSTYWPYSGLIANSTTHNLKNPTIGFDSSGTVYCVWESGFSVSDIQINMAWNSSSTWTIPINITNVNKNIYPQIPANMSGAGNEVGLIFKDDTNDDIVFHSIPEFSDLFQLMILILILQFIFVFIKRKSRIGNNNNSKFGVKKR